MKLSDTQLVILQRAADDALRLCRADAKLPQAPRIAIAKRLLSLGLVEAEPWHTTEAPERRFDDHVLRITDAGLRAIGIEPEEERAEAAEAVADAPRSGRGFWREAEEAAARGELPPAPDFSAPTHAPYRRKLERLIELAQAGDAAGLRAVHINPTSTTPKALARWRDLAVRAIEAREASR
jgi:hypothetical protein